MIDKGALSLNLKSISDAWTTSASATFDTVHSLKRTRKGNRLKLRFSYIHLIRQIQTREAAISMNPACEYRQNRAFNASRVASGVAIREYFEVKENNSETPLSRSELSEHIRIGKRWLWLAGPTPFQLSLYSKAAETIMYVLPASFFLWILKAKKR
jgi:hypothetical protein